MKYFLTLLMLAFVGCSQSEQWMAFVYPDIDNISVLDKSDNYIIGNFKTFDECQTAAIGAMRANMFATDKQGAYICGLNCTRREDFANLLVCKEKRK